MQPDDLRDHFTVRLKHSDAAGVIFFANAFQVEQEFFERWLESGGLSLRGMLDGSHAPTPVVHCEADYRMPIRCGDRLTARIDAIEIGRSAFTLSWKFSLGDAQAIAARVKRVAIDRRAGESTDLPEAFREWLLATQAKTSTV